MLGKTVASLSKPIKATLKSLRQTAPKNPLHLKTGRLARLTQGATTLHHGNLTLLATYAPSPTGHLTVDFRSKAAAHGIIPATWARRELQPLQTDLLTSRLIDRSLRPLLNAPAQITVSVLSGPGLSVDALAVNAASAAIVAAGVDWEGPVAAARAVWLDGQYLLFPSEDELSRSHMCVFVAVNFNGRLLSMGLDTRRPVERDVVIGGVKAAVQAALDILPVQTELGDLVSDMREEQGPSSFPRRIPVEHVEEPEISLEQLVPVFNRALSVYEDAFVECRLAPGKAHRAKVITEAQEGLLEQFEQLPMKHVLQQAQLAARVAYRKVLLRDSVRMDGRQYQDLRPIRCERSFLPGNVHGSALFERGDTQVLACATIGLKRRSIRTEEYVDDPGAGLDRSFFVHYSFPPYATGEAGRFAGVINRREVGHSALAERALLPVLDISNPQSETEYPYALRLSADVLSSDGSSSMATVCAGSLALADAGAPIEDCVAGVAMGLVTGPRFENEHDDYVVLTDILGAEDHFGDMDMKVTGTANGLTAFQMDVKCKQGLPMSVVDNVLGKAQEAIVEILGKMEEQCGSERNEMCENAPRVIEVPVDVGVTVKTLLKDRAAGLRDIEEKSNCRLFFDGKRESIRIEGPDLQSATNANGLLTKALAGIEIGTKLVGKVTDVKQTYAVLEVSNGVSGILHVSKMQVVQNTSDSNASLDKLRYPDVRAMMSRGDEVDVVVIESCRERNVLRFSLPAGLRKPPARSQKSLGDDIDAFLAATKSKL